MSMSHNEAVSILKVCYKNLSGFGVDRPVFRPAENPGSGIQTHVDSSNMAYGEITYAGMEHLCRAANLQPYDVFYDLGSGVGKLVLYLALLGNCSKAVGLEIGERRHADAMIALKRLIKRRLAVEEPLTTEVDFALRDISRERYHDVTVAFISNLLMERSITERTLKALLCCPPLRRVVSIVPLNHPRLKLLKNAHVSCTWARISSWQFYDVLPVATMRTSLLKNPLRNSSTHQFLLSTGQWDCAGYAAARGPTPGSTTSPLRPKSSGAGEAGAEKSPGHSSTAQSTPQHRRGTMGGTDLRGAEGGRSPSWPRTNRGLPLLAGAPVMENNWPSGVKNGGSSSCGSTASVSSSSTMRGAGNAALATALAKSAHENRAAAAMRFASPKTPGLNAAGGGAEGTTTVVVHQPLSSTTSRGGVTSAGGTVVGAGAPNNLLGGPFGGVVPSTPKSRSTSIITGAPSTPNKPRSASDFGPVHGNLQIAGWAKRISSDDVANKTGLPGGGAPTSMSPKPIPPGSFALTSPVSSASGAASPGGGGVMENAVAALLLSPRAERDAMFKRRAAARKARDRPWVQEKARG